MVQPFLFRFARSCVSPSRAESSVDYEYDEVSDMVVWLGDPSHPPAITADGPRQPPKTKKNDIEKGEDTKDRRMWR